LNEQQQDSALLRQVLQVAKRLARPFELRKVLESIVDAGREILHADKASVLLFDSDRQELYSEATSAREEIRFPASKGIAGETLTRLGIIRIDDCYSDKRFDASVDRQTGYRTTSLISLPLIGLDEGVVGVMQVLNAERGFFDDSDEWKAEILAGLAALAIQRVQALEDRVRNVKLKRDLDLAREIQENLLPDDIPPTPGYEVAVFSRPAEETQVRAMLRMAGRLGTGLDTLCEQLDDQLKADLPSNKFVTMFVGVLDRSTHEIAYHSLGQAPLLHFRAASADCRWLPASAPPAGLVAHAGFKRPSPISLEPGDVFVLLSDGFYEYENPSGEQMGRPRVGSIIERASSADAQEIVAELCGALERFSEGAAQDDDLTAIVVKRDEKR
jgi:phosphoserine phosphatase